MPNTLQRLEKNFFRSLNSVVEPAVRKGLFSSACTPAGLIVLETTGFKSGQSRRTPLAATRLGKYVFISTARGKRSFWVKNLQKKPDTQYFIGGKLKQASSFVIAPDTPFEKPSSLPPMVSAIVDLMAKRADKGWSFAVLKTA
ncbi:MAG: nitroreductase/quinone reductase family protein [Halioglobus sp.]